MWWLLFEFTTCPLLSKGSVSHYIYCWILWPVDINRNMFLGWCSVLLCWTGLGELPTSSPKPWACYLGQSFAHPILPNKQHWGALFGWCPWSEGAIHSKWWNGKLSQNCCCTSGTFPFFFLKKHHFSRFNLHWLVIPTRCHNQCLYFVRFLQKSTTLL